MSEILPFVVIGLASGAIFGLAGVGLILTYRTSGVFNFGHGALASIAAYLFYELYVVRGLPWPLAMVATAVFVGTVGGLLLERMARVLSGSSAATKVVCTVGLLVAVNGLLVVRYGSTPLPLQSYLPTSTFHVLGVNISYEQLIVFVFGVVLTAGLAVMLRSTRLGIAMRAAVDNPALLELTGMSSSMVQRAAWIIGTTIAAVSGVLVAPTFGLDPLLLAFLVVQAFGAAAIGRFRSLEWTFAGGLILGVIANVGQRYATDFPSLLGLPPSVPFIALFGLLMFARSSTLREVGIETKQRVTEMTPIPASWRRIGLAAFAVAALAVPHVVGARLSVFTGAAAMVIVFLSLGTVVNTSGQISLCHAAFVAIGATSFSILKVSFELPWMVALVGAGLAALPVGILVALPAVRLPGVYLALATFGLGVLLERMVYRSFLMFGDVGNRQAPRPDIPGFGTLDDTQYYYFALLLAVAVGVLVVVLQRTRLGRILRSLADSQPSLVAFGASPTAALVLVFCLTAFMAAIGGAVLVAAAGASSATWDAMDSLAWLTVLVIAGRRVIPAAVISALLVSALPLYLPDGLIDWQPVFFGAAAVTVALVRASGFDLVGRMRTRIESTTGRESSPFRPAPAGPRRTGSRRRSARPQSVVMSGEA